jgi:hypothetical protein
VEWNELVGIRTETSNSNAKPGVKAFNHGLDAIKAHLLLIPSRPAICVLPMKLFQFLNFGTGDLLTKLQTYGRKSASPDAAAILTINIDPESIPIGLVFDLCNLWHAPPLWV